MKNIGFFISSISEHNLRVLNAINEYASAHPYDHVVLFNSTYDTINSDNRYYTTHISYAKYFNGILFVFDSTDASVTAAFPGPKKQILYADAIYWQLQKNVPYALWNNIFSNTNLEIITTNTENAKIYDLCWKPPILISEFFSKETIENAIQKI